MEQERYRKLISDGGGCVSLVRFFLVILGFFYGLVIRLRNIFYKRGIFKTHKASKPVISVGNITLGGTGKTPVIIWLCGRLKEKGYKVGILTRGYKASRLEGGGSGWLDEPGLLAEGCEGAEIIVNSDRVAGAGEAINRFGVDVLLMDDGFQHRRLGRALDIVTIDATEPFGYGSILPGGFLREPISSLARADAVVITRTEQVKQEQLEKIEEKILKVKSDMVIARTIHGPVCVSLSDGSELSVGELEGRKVYCFCGIGNPRAFERTVRDTGSEVVGFKIFNDHHCYDGEDVSEIFQAGIEAGAELILTTKKDWLKFASQIESEGKDTGDKGKVLIGYLGIEIEFLDGEEKIRKLIEERMAVTISG